jgi:hypothetical protein
LISILLIGIGRYSELIPGLINSFNGKISRNEIQFLVFTNQKKIITKKVDIGNVEYFYFKDSGWPLNTLLRFEMFNSVRNKLEASEKVYFMNANLRVIDDDFIDKLKNANFLFLKHPGFSGLRFWLSKPYDKNPLSSCFVDFFRRIFSDYIQGCFYGGDSRLFIKINETLLINFYNDWSAGYVSRVHDESYLNHYRIYLMDDKYEILSSLYAFPEGWFSLFKPKCISIDKSKFFGEGWFSNFKDT